MHPNHAAIKYLGILGIIIGGALAGVKDDWADVVWDTPEDADPIIALTGTIRRDPNRPMEQESWWQDNAFNDKVEFGMSSPIPAPFLHQSPTCSS